MVILVWFLSLLAALLILSYQRASLSVATMGMSVLLLLLSILTRPGGWALLIVGILWSAWAIIFNMRPLRRQLISNAVYAMLARHAPKFSPTEQAVLSAGNIGWEVGLFRGIPDFNKLANMPWVQLTLQERAFLDGPVTKLCEMIDPWCIHAHQKIPDDIWNYLKIQGFFGLVIPVQYGGKGFSAFAHAQVIMKLASVSTAVATIASVPNSLGPAELLLHYGSEEQKQYYLPRLACGEEVPCFALTSPVAGSDASAIIDSGVICRYQKNGQEVLGMRLNWDKRYITLAPVATLLGLAFQLYDPDHLLGDQEKLGITCALISIHTPGVKTGRYHAPLHCAFPNGPTQGVDVYVALDAVIGGVNQIGKGWQMLMERLAAGRSISLPSISMGSIKIATVSSGAYARIRRQFNTYIGDFDGIQEVLAQMAANAYIAESLRLFSISEIDQGIHSATAAAITKYHTTELGRKIIHAAMDIHGGKGICMGPHNYLAQLHFESPIGITVEGANILTRSLIIFGQGALRCHPFLLEEIFSVKKGDKKSFDKAFFSHMGYLLSNQIRVFILGLSQARFVGTFFRINRKHYQKLAHCSAIFSFISDVLLIITGNSLKRKELLSARLGDLLSYLYMVSAILKNHQANGEDIQILPLIDWCCEEIFFCFQEKIGELLSNLPNRFIAGWLKGTLFPFGKWQRRPKDTLTVQVAKLLMEPSPVREYLMADAYFSGILTDLEKNLQKIMDVEPLLRKKQLMQIITEAEEKQIEEAEKIRLTFINVDDFASSVSVSGKNNHG